MDKFSELNSEIGQLWHTYHGMYLDGAWMTIKLAVMATIIGCLIGFICGILQTIPVSKKDNPVKKFFLGLIRAILRIYVEVFRGTPMILQAVFVYYGIPYFFGNTLDPVFAAYLVVSINTGAYMAETVRGGIISVDDGQTEGAMAIGMDHFQTMLYVVLPQTLRNILPQIGNNLIINIKDTSVMFIISYIELFAIHKSVSGATYMYFPSAVIEMGIYLVMTVISSLLLRRMEKRMDGSDNYDMASLKSDTLAQTSGMANTAPRKKKFKKIISGGHNHG